MLALEAGLAAALILIMKDEGLPQAFQATGPAIGLCVALAFASITKSRLLRRQLGEPVSGWRWDLAWATAAGIVVGAAGSPLPAADLAAVHRRSGDPRRVRRGLWTKGFGPEDRELFRMRKSRSQELRDAEKRRWRAIRSPDDIV